MTTDESSAPEEAASETEGATEAVSSGKTPRVGLHSMLTRDTDMASRPGFRSPSNKRSKAQAKSKKRNKKKRR